MTPIKGTPVRVDPVVKSVYRYIDKKTYLDWGLTSDWSVNGPRKRRSIGGDGAPTTETATEEEGARAVKKIKVEEDGEENENAASEGYGEMTEGSIERLLQLLGDLARAELDAPLPVRTPEKESCPPAAPFTHVSADPLRQRTVPHYFLKMLLFKDIIWVHIALDASIHAYESSGQAVLRTLVPIDRCL